MLAQPENQFFFANKVISAGMFAISVRVAFSNYSDKKRKF